ncbi:hypothetical protein [Roseibium sp. RKSG952]|uniref:hypothetical protein n=1 Tax=Roseibium sp. RKSG952 TaxID=2529384 RepID=UPI0012BB706E|nr:hypothetical protein [Roseibium sp. RKSG952]MTH96622.1 hypothetical protein [Roseibium sp. RKSG952]
MSNQPKQSSGFSPGVQTALDQLKRMQGDGVRVHGSVNELFTRLKDLLVSTLGEKDALRKQLDESIREYELLSSKNDVLLCENQGLYRDLRQLTDSISMAFFEIGKGGELFGDLNAQLDSIVKMMDEPSDSDQLQEKVNPLECGPHSEGSSGASIPVPGSFSIGGFHPVEEKELVS